MYKLVSPNINMFDKFIGFCEEIRNSNGVKNIPDVSKIDPVDYINKLKTRQINFQSDFWCVDDDDIVGIGSIR